jgi:acetolactate synthase regulatory subunit
MTSHVVIDFAAAEGAVLRMLGLVERRGFRVRSIAMREEGEAGLLALDLQGEGPNRSLDVLALQLRRLHEVRNVSIPGTSS